MANTSYVILIYKSVHNLNCVKTYILYIHKYVAFLLKTHIWEIKFYKPNNMKLQ